MSEQGEGIRELRPFNRDHLVGGDLLRLQCLDHGGVECEVVLRIKSVLASGSGKGINHIVAVLEQNTSGSPLKLNTIYELLDCTEDSARTQGKMDNHIHPHTYLWLRDSTLPPRAQRIRTPLLIGGEYLRRDQSYPLFT